MEEQEKGLKLEVIWKDDDMLELEVTVSNINFRGVTQVYDTSESIKDLANKLGGFPKNEEPVFYELGEKDSYAYVSIKFYSISAIRLIGVQVHLEENVNTNFRSEEKSKVSLELIIEPNFIDVFEKELLSIAVKQEGYAKLLSR
jgi:hypothetical protein